MLTGFQQCCRCGPPQQAAADLVTLCTNRQFIDSEIQKSELRIKRRHTLINGMEASTATHSADESAAITAAAATKGAAEFLRLDALAALGEADGSGDGREIVAELMGRVGGSVGLPKRHWR